MGHVCSNPLVPYKSDCTVKESFGLNISMLKQCAIHTERLLH